MKAIAKAFKALRYNVAAFADGDADDQFSPAHAKELTDAGIPVIMWSDKLSLEQRAFQDLPWPEVLVSVTLARDNFGYSVRDQVATKLGSKLDLDIGNWADSTELRTAIGATAKKSNWFKDISRGDQWFRAIQPAFENKAFAKTDLAVQLNQLWAWIEND